MPADRAPRVSSANERPANGSTAQQKAHMKLLRNASLVNAYSSGLTMLLVYMSSVNT